MLSRSPSASRSSTDRRHAAGALALGAFDRCCARLRPRCCRRKPAGRRGAAGARDGATGSRARAPPGPAGDSRAGRAPPPGAVSPRRAAPVAGRHRADARRRAGGARRGPDRRRGQDRRNASAREREAIRTLRDLSFAIEPVILRDRGFAARRTRARRAGRARAEHPVALDLTAADALGESARVALYQSDARSARSSPSPRPRPDQPRRRAACGRLRRRGCRRRRRR